MRSLSALALLAASAKAVTVYLAGDSTMTAKGNNDGTAGWGLYLPNYISLAVSNQAIAGRSARSFTDQGRFAAITALLVSGDYVVIEFGHNDGGTPTATDNGRPDCPPSGTNYAVTCTGSSPSGGTETVLTYEKYIVNAVKAFTAKGANVLISSPTPNNPWETGTFVYSTSVFTTYIQAAIAEAGGIFVDHALYTATKYKSYGATVTDAYFPNDHTHTSPDGANLVARCFALALAATNSTLKNYLT